MSKVINNPRSGCVLHGALQAVQEIKGAVPVVHANAGCGVIDFLTSGKSSGSSSEFSGYSIPGTAAQERHVIFGGASRLREQIKNTTKVVNGDLYVILNSCESAMVGDDVDAMTREIVEQGEPVVDTLAAGFNGNAHQGYENVITDILKGLPGIKSIPSEKDKKLVNIFGIVPHKDVNWQGNLEEIKRIFEGVGLKVNLFFGNQGSVQDLINAYSASVSVVFSRWGEAPAKLLKTKADIPFVQVDSQPVNAVEEEGLLKLVSEYVDLNEKLIDEFINIEKEYENGYLSQIVYHGNSLDLAKRVVIIADEEQTIRYSKILGDIFAADVASIIIVDASQKDEIHETNNTELLNSLAERVYYTQDKKEIEGIIKSSNAEIIFGSSIEQAVADKLKLPLLKVAYPIYHSFILNKASIGTRGIPSFAEDYVETIKVFNLEQKLALNDNLKELKGGEKWHELSQGKNFIRNSNSTTGLQTKAYTLAQK